MPAPRHQFSAADREMLRQALESKLGIQLGGKAACIRASDMLRQEGGYAPSGTTLYHLVVSPAGDRSPFLETLHVLSRLLGFKDWQGMRESTKREVQEPGLRIDQAFALPALLGTCVRRGCYEVLDDFLDQWAGRIGHVAIFDIGLAMYTVLYMQPELARPFFARYAAHPVVRKGLFELMADPGFQLCHAAEGLQHYLNASRPVEDEQGFRDRLFSRSMLFRHHYLTGDPRLIDEGRRLYTDTVALDDLCALHLFPAARYLTYALWYDVIERRTARRKRRETMVMEWAAIRLLQDRSELERNIILHTLVEGSLKVGLLERVIPELVRLFPEVDPDVFDDATRLQHLLATIEPNGLRVHFNRVVRPV